MGGRLQQMVPTGVSPAQARQNWWKLWVQERDTGP
jgi:hypothetical protein